MVNNPGSEDKLKAKVKEQLKKKVTPAEGGEDRLGEDDFAKASAPAAVVPPTGFRRLRASNLQEVSMFCRELAILLEAGYPLLRALTLLANKTSNRRFAYEVERVARQVEKGGTLAKGLAGSDAYFDSTMVSMIEAGEASGELVPVLTNIADDLDANDELADKIRQAISYPLLTAGIAVLVFLIILIFVIPTFAAVYDKHNMELPTVTALLVGMSTFITGYWWLWMPALALGGWYFWRRSGQSTQALDGLLIRMPLIGEIIVLGTMARFATSLKVMLSNGVPILQAIQLAKGVVTNRTLRDVVQQMSDNAESGKSMAAPLAKAGYFPPIMVDMLFVGEESGKLPFVLGQIVRSLRMQLDRIISRLSVILGPVMTLVVGVMVLAIILSLFIPYFGFLTEIAETPFRQQH